MRKFLAKVIWFLVPLAVVLAGLEAYLRSVPNSYKLKYGYMQRHAGTVETLVLGSSHTYHGLKPSCFSSPCFNLAYSSQDLKRDDYLLSRFIDGMDSLKQVVVPISYHTMPEMMEDFSSSEVLLKYYGMYMDYPPARFSFELTIPRWYDKILMQLRGESVCKSDSLGFGTDYMPEPDNLDEEHALSTVAYHTHKDFSHVDENMRILEHIISECGCRGVKVILLTTPVTDLYCDNLDVRQLELMHACADSLASWHDNVVYWDFMRDARFSYGDFHDVDHLAVIGAEKFSRILSDSIKSLYR